MSVRLAPGLIETAVLVKLEDSVKLAVEEEGATAGASFTAVTSIDLLNVVS